MTRPDGRALNQLRQVKLVLDYQSFAEGSALIEMGLTRVVCAASVEERVPPFLRGTGKGWVTAEYAMLPRSTLSRAPRESSAGGPRGRTMEIQRMIGRCLRAVTDLEALGERTIQVDCDVIQADGGTRTAAINGAYVAIYQACRTLVKSGVISQIPLKAGLGAISVGLIDGHPCLDMTYGEDQRAQVDFNVAMTDKGELVEIQGAAEGHPFSTEQLMEVIATARAGMTELFEFQRNAIASMEGPLS